METEFLIKLLVAQSYITPEDGESALILERAQKGTALNRLLQEGKVSRSTLGSAIAEHFNTTYSDLDTRPPSADELARIPEDIARTYRVIYVGEKDGQIRVATDFTEKEGLVAVLEQNFPDKKVMITYAFTESVNALLIRYQKALNTRFAEIMKHERRIAPELLDEIIRDALTYRASDVHFEPQNDKTIIRFRIDGMLQLAGSITRDHYDNVLNRMKIQSNLRTDEHFAPQDGAIRFKSGEITVDLRLSVIPTLDGEKAVLRILAEYVQGLTFEALGFSARHVEQFDRAAKKPFGMILTVGPTGSGKTTTLYTLIRKLNTPEVNITTIEDPVEYRMEGINQIQVNQKTNLTFAKGLRAVVRQDPNIILVGEIRDTETAETAVNAALTGHLLLSTFHANDAATAIPRLLDLGIEPFLLSSTLELVVAQRLARRICESCRASYEIKKTVLEKQYLELKGYFSEKIVTLYKGEGCASCNETGYKGRITIIEIIEMSPALKNLIGTHPSSSQIRDLARSEGGRGLFEDGIDKAMQGLTTIEEVRRIASIT